MSDASTIQDLLAAVEQRLHTEITDLFAGLSTKVDELDTRVEEFAAELNAKVDELAARR